MGSEGRSWPGGGAIISFLDCGPIVAVPKVLPPKTRRFLEDGSSLPFMTGFSV